VKREAVRAQLEELEARKRRPNAERDPWRDGDAWHQRKRAWQSTLTAAILRARRGSD